MISGRPSKTALRVAIRREVHQQLDSPLVLVDPIAPRILAPYQAEMQKALADGRSSFSTAFRAFIVARSRIAEDELSRAYDAGVRQYVLLGAGLDTFACRNPHAELQVFEVDHPATQAWKLQLLKECAIEANSATYVDVDFETQGIAERLHAAGFNANAPAVFAWLGVVPYLTFEAFREALQMIAALPSPTTVVFDYALPISALGWSERFAVRALANRVAKAGEPFRLFFTPHDLAQQLRLLGFTKQTDLGREEINARYFTNRNDGHHLRGTAGRVMIAGT